MVFGVCEHAGGEVFFLRRENNKIQRFIIIYKQKTISMLFGALLHCSPENVYFNLFYLKNYQSKSFDIKNRDQFAIYIFLKNF